MYPIIEYAHMIKKNTAEFTQKDFAGYMKWWLQQKPRRDLLEATEAQRKVYDEDVKKTQQWIKETEMAKQNKSAEVEEVEVSAEETVCSMELTKIDVEALIFSIERTFAEYEMEEESPYTISLKGLLEGLKGV